VISPRTGGTSRESNSSPSSNLYVEAERLLHGSMRDLNAYLAASLLFRPTRLKSDAHPSWTIGEAYFRACFRAEFISPARFANSSRARRKPVVREHFGRLSEAAPALVGQAAPRPPRICMGSTGRMLTSGSISRAGRPRRFLATWFPPLRSKKIPALNRAWSFH